MGKFSTLLNRLFFSSPLSPGSLLSCSCRRSARTAADTVSEPSLHYSTAIPLSGTRSPSTALQPLITPQGEKPALRNLSRSSCTRCLPRSRHRGRRASGSGAPDNPEARPATLAVRLGLVHVTTGETQAPSEGSGPSRRKQDLPSAPCRVDARPPPRA